MNQKHIQKIEELLARPIRGSVSFASQNLLKKDTITKLEDTLESEISSLMRKIYDYHCITKTQESLLNMDRELLYVDASKKGDFDLFTYMTREYFNVSSESVRLEYNENYIKNLQGYDENLFSDDILGKVGSTDLLFDISIDYFKKLDYFKENGSDGFIGFIPMLNIELLMSRNQQTDLNIFLDNINSVSQQEMLHINNLIRSGLLMGSEKRLGLYINNGSGKWNYSSGKGNLDPQDGHDMKIHYF